ncbi:MAG: WbqC family protein [Agriterribacter sp.]
MLLIDLQYLGSVIYYKNLIKLRYINIEQCERWQKMSFRNRCSIAGGNGKIDLSIPVVGGRNSDEMIRDIKIDNMQKWQNVHWRSITSAYNHSPWFEFYKDEFQAFYSHRYEYLWDFNIDLMQWVLKQLKADVQIGFTETYKKEYTNPGTLDLRNQILPRNITAFSGESPVYRQVFEDKTGFIPCLSIIDLLFCEGNNALHLLT